MTNAFGVVLDSASVRRAAVEGVSETVITAIYLIHERSIDEIVAKLRPGELEQGLQALIPEKRHGSPWSLRHAAWTVLLVATTGLSAVLADCSGLATNNGEVPATGLDLSYREVIASHLKKTFKNYSTYDLFEISDPRWVHSMKGWNWLTCVRFQATATCASMPCSSMARKLLMIAMPFKPTIVTCRPTFRSSDRRVDWIRCTRRIQSAQSAAHACITFEVKFRAANLATQCSNGTGREASRTRRLKRTS